MHREEFDVGVSQHACSKMAVQGLGPIVIRKDKAQEAHLGGTNQSAGLRGVAHEKVKFPLVHDKRLSLPFSVSLAALGEFSDDRAGLVFTVGQPDLSLLLERDNRLPACTKVFGERASLMVTRLMWCVGCPNGSK